MNLRKSILALSVVAGHYRQVYNQKIESIENISKFLESTLSAFFDNMKGEINAKKTTFCISTNYFMLFIRM